MESSGGVGFTFSWMSSCSGAERDLSSGGRWTSGGWRSWTGESWAVSIDTGVDRRWCTVWWGLHGFGDSDEDGSERWWFTWYGFWDGWGGGVVESCMNGYELVSFNFF